MRTQVYIPCIPYVRPRVALLVGATVILSGCWTPPSAAVRPEGKPRIIAQGIEIDRVVDSARVESVDRAARMVGLSVRAVPLPACKVGRSVRNWGDIRVADHVRATIEEVLTVYVAGTIGGSPDARVLVVDPSYRLLTVRYPNGGADTFKIALHTRMSGMEAGDAVAIRQVEVTRLHVQRYWRKASARPRLKARSAR